MQRQYIKWYSPSLHREMELLAFGDRGFPVVVFPTSGGRFFEYEDRGMVNALRPKMDRGELQAICVDSVDQESWYNRSIHPADRLHRQNAFDAYLVNELAPFVRERTSWPQMATTGCSFGGYHAINFALRHPDLVTYAVSMSGAFDMPRRFLDGYYDNNAYLNSPLDYLPDANTLLSVTDHCLRRRHYIKVIVAGKQPAPQWLDMDAAIKHCTAGLGIWPWASNDAGNESDVVMACAGDVPTLETLAAVEMLRLHLPDLKIRVINIVDLMTLQSSTEHPHGLGDRDFDALFTKDKPVIFAYHGYPRIGRA